MRGSITKMLRGRINQKTVGQVWTQYEGHALKKKYRQGKKIFESIFVQVRLDPNCGRALYQRVKRKYHAECRRPGRETQRSISGFSRAA